MNTVFSTNELVKQYGKKVVVDHVTMTVPQGSIYGLIGENGAGKTTIMKMLVGLISATSGNFTLFESDDHINSRRRVGCVIENPALYPNFTARENLKAFSKMMGLNDASEIDSILQIVGLAGVEKKKTKHYSLGMKQRLSIGVALLGNPDFLVLDEPINGLDPAGIAGVRNLLIDLNKAGKTILISSHILGELFKVATHYGVIRLGKLVGEFTEEQLLAMNNNIIKVKCDNKEKAIELVKTQFGIDGKIISEDDTVDFPTGVCESADINMLLVNSGIRVSEISVTKDNLESYVIDLMQGGAKNA